MTGFAAPLFPVVKMFRYRQSSLVDWGPPNDCCSVTMHESAYCVASNRPWLAGGCGGIQRRSPTGGAANGIPKKTFTPLLFTKPRTGPSAVLTVGLFALLTCPGASGLGPGTPPGAANTGADAIATPH